MKRIIYIAIFSILLISCEEVIELELNSTDPQIVIEGTITNQPGPYTIKITQTTDYFNPEEYPKVSYAVVNITDSEGNFETLLETEPGVYQTSSFQGIEGRTYELYVNINGEEFTASSYLPPITPIDSLDYEDAPRPDNSSNEYMITCYFHDQVDVENYYSIKLYKNSVVSKKYFLIDDLLLDGKNIDYGRIEDEIKLNDEVVIELMNIDANVYDYYNTLSSILSTRGMSSSTPANPTSNISNGALGFFGAYSYTSDTIIVK